MGEGATRGLGEGRRCGVTTFGDAGASRCYTPVMTRVECPCGDIEMELGGEPVVQLYCHCDDCQRAHGAACAPVAIYHTRDVKVVRGEPREWRLVSTPRFFCPNCGTRLFVLGSEQHCAVNAYLLPAGSFRPALHIYCEFAPLPLGDGLPHYARVPARWGGSDEQMHWPSVAAGAK